MATYTQSFHCPSMEILTRIIEPRLMIITTMFLEHTLPMSMTMAMCPSHLPLDMPQLYHLIRSLPTTRSRRRRRGDRTSPKPLTNGHNRVARRPLRPLPCLSVLKTPLLNLLVQLRTSPNPRNKTRTRLTARPNHPTPLKSKDASPKRR